MNRIFDYNDLQIKDAVKGFMELNKERKVLNTDAFKEYTMMVLMLILKQK